MTTLANKDCSGRDRFTIAVSQLWLPMVLVGLVGVTVGLAVDHGRVAYAWLITWLYFVSLSLGALFLVIAQHLFGAVWLVPLRRVCEHLSCLVFPYLGLAFLPVVILGRDVFPWRQGIEARIELSESVVGAAMACGEWLALSVLLLGSCWWITHKLRSLSLEQDKSTRLILTGLLRRYSVAGVFVLGLTSTGAAVLWMKSVSPGWFSTIYGFCLFTGSVWFAVAVIWILGLGFRGTRTLGDAYGQKQFRSLATLFFAFTLLHAYMNYSQYFVIWNANLPDETWWYVVRQQGTWRETGLVLVFGHFLVPFILLLPARWKLNRNVALVVCVLALLMHYLDIAFNVLPAGIPDGFPINTLWIDCSCVALMCGWLLKAFAHDLCRYAPVPIGDPCFWRAREAADDLRDEPDVIEAGACFRNRHPVSDETTLT